MVKLIIPVLALLFILEPERRALIKSCRIPSNLYEWRAIRDLLVNLRCGQSGDSQVVVEKLKHSAAPPHYFLEGRAFLSVCLVFIILSKTEEKRIKE